MTNRVRVLDEVWIGIEKGGFGRFEAKGKKFW